MKFYSKYEPAPQVKTKFKKPSKADESQKAACDINNIMKKYLKTGVVDHIAKSLPVFGDVSAFGDFQQSMEQIHRAEQLFGELPARARERFNNNPAEFLDFMGNPENIEEAVKLGLATKREEPPAPSTPPETKTQPQT